MDEVELTVRDLNHSLLKDFGKRVRVKNEPITVLRVPGGYLFEYYHNYDLKKIQAVTFISTDEFTNE